MINRSTMMLTFLLGLTAPMQILATTNQAPLPDNLAQTLDLYLSSDASYKSGDLITRSHIEEFQSYLRRTQGHSVATHSRWQKRMLKDSDSLSKTFYNGGADILRGAAAATGGYAKIHQLLRKPAGRQALEQAVAHKSIQLVVDAIADEAQKHSAAQEKPAQADKRMPPEQLYTADELVAAVEAFHARASQEIAVETSSSEQEVRKTPKK